MKRLAIVLGLLVSNQLQAEDLWQAFELARASDPQVKIADAQKQSAAEGITLARSALLPQVNGGFSYSRSDGESTFVQPTAQPNGQVVGVTVSRKSKINSDNLSLDLNQTIYDHANYTRLKAARAQAESAAQSYRAAEQNLIVRVAQAYFQALTAQDSLTSAQAEEKAVGRQLEQAEQRFNVGLTAITDVHEARARHDGAVAAAILAENSLDDAKAALTELTGKNIDVIASVKEKIAPVTPQPADWQEWVEIATSNSPLLAARQALASAADHNVQTAKSGRYPTVSSFVSYGDGSSSGDTTFAGGVTDTNNSNKDTTIGVRVNVPIFSGFGTTARIKQAVFDAERAKDDVEQQRRAITRQTRNAYRSVIAGSSEVKAREQALVSAKSALEATEAGFEVGTRTIVDVLLSQQVLFQAQRDFSRARHDLLVNSLRLRASAGTITTDDLKTVNAQLKTGAN
jgi:outer membrane protein